MDKDLENFIIVILGGIVITIYFSLSIPTLIEFLTGEKMIRERLTELEQRVSLIERQKR